MGHSSLNHLAIDLGLGADALAWQARTMVQFDLSVPIFVKAGEPDRGAVQAAILVYFVSDHQSHPTFPQALNSDGENNCSED